jgi:hypothetical protein
MIYYETSDTSTANSRILSLCDSPLKRGYVMVAFVIECVGGWYTGWITISKN